jgi:TonB-dependent receptor-like protein
VRLRRALWQAGLGLVAGAVLQGTAGAQVRDTSRVRRDTSVVPVPVPADSAAADSARLANALADSLNAIAKRKTAADTIKRPLARAESPLTPDITESYRWGRDEILATGAISLSDLVERVPGVTMYRGGWAVMPHTGAYFGDFGQIRVFRDGVELDPLDRRSGFNGVAGGTLDLALIPIWNLEEVVVEQGAQQLRVYLRTWRVARTTPYTRVDISTGDLETNTYRGYYGRRFGGGGALQVGAQQLSTTDPRLGGDGDQLAIFGRTGWAGKRWSVDALFDRTHRTRNVAVDDESAPVLPGVDASRTDAYLRAGYGDPEAGGWAQLIAATARYSESLKNPAGSSGIPGLPVDTVDTTSSRAQYVVAGGYTRGAIRLSGTARLRSFQGLTYLSPSVRAAYDRRLLSVSLFGERESEAARYRVDGMVRVRPLSFLTLGGGVSRSAPDPDDGSGTTTSLRGEAALRLGRLWITGGVVQRDTVVVPPPVIFDTAFRAVRRVPATLLLASIRGPLWKAITLDVVGVRAKEDGFYQPQYEVRSELYVSTSWLDRFPRGNFHVKASVMHEYRTAALFPRGDEVVKSSQYRTIGTLLEIRLLDAVLFYQFRNLLGDIYEQVPGLIMPRQAQLYGVRWEFYN